MDPVLTGLLAAAGLLAGDALDPLVDSLGTRRSVYPPWRGCRACGAASRGVGLVPLVRVAARRRGCPVCGLVPSHPWRPVALAASGAVVLGLFAAAIGADVSLAPFAVLGLSLVAISFVDLERLRIPNRLVYPTLAFVFPLLVMSSAVDNRWSNLARAVVAGAASFLGFFIVHLAAPRGMGFGDVRLAGLVGLSVGWLGLGHAFVAFFASFVLGGVGALVVMLATGGGRKARIPFGPFLAAGAAVAVVWGGPLSQALLHRHG